MDTQVAPEDRALIAALAPDLAVLAVHRDNGQFNDVLIVNGEWVFRFAKSPAVVAEMPGEVAFLRAVAGLLPLPTPEPRYVRLEPPHSGMGYRMLPGAALTNETISIIPGAIQVTIGRRLGAFLRALHTLPSDLLAGQPPHDGREEWADLYANFHAHLFPRMRPDARDEVAERFETFLADEHGWAPVPRHGDFGAGNVLFDAQTSEVTGVIDFGSAGLGDPAVDIAALATMGEHVLRGGLAAYPEAAGYLDRAAFYRATFALQQAWYGLRDGSQADFEDGIARYR